MLKPTNTGTYRKKLFKFFSLWTIVTAVIVFACLQLIKAPDKIDKDLERRVKALEKVEQRQEMISATLDSVNATIKLLRKSAYNEGLVSKLESYPKEDLGDDEMKDKLSKMCTSIADLISSTVEEKKDLEKEKTECKENNIEIEDSHKRTLEHKNERLRLLQEDVSRLEAELARCC